MKTYEFGIMALGFAGMAHADVIRKNPRAHLKAICTRDAEKLAQVAKEYEVEKASTEFEELLAADLDVLIVCTPDHLHTDYVKAALDAGLNVVCEKPLTTTVEDAQQLVELADKSGKVFMTGQCARYFERSQLGRSIVDQGELGRIFYAEADYLHDCAEFLRDWRIDPAAPQNMVLGGGCHPIDLLRWLVGDVEQVHAFANKIAFPPTNPIEHDCTMISLQFRSGAIGKVLVSVGCRRPYSMGLGLYGTEGTLIDEKLFLAKIPGLQDFMEMPIGAHSHGENTVFRDQLTHLVECLDEGKQPIADVREGAKNVATCLAAVESIETGQVVKVFNEF